MTNCEIPLQEPPRQGRRRQRTQEINMLEDTGELVLNKKPIPLVNQVLAEMRNSTKILADGTTEAEYGEKGALTRELQQEIERIDRMSKNTRPDTTEVPEQYKEFTELFKENMEQRLVDHAPWDHAIEINEGEEVKPGRIYSLTATELEELRKYINGFLKKGQVRKSTSSAGFPVLFVPKKDGKL